MIPKKLFLGGAWRETAQTIPVVNPGTGAVCGHVCMADRPMVAKAITDAHAAFVGWRQLPGRTRGEFLRRLSDELERRQEEIAGLITMENGKPLDQNRGEVTMSIDHLRWFSEEARRGYGRIVPPQVAGKRHLVVKTPVGVVAAITSWNFLLVLAVRKIAPALAAGCPVILKPASTTPLCALAFAGCALAAGLPPSVLQVLVGRATDVAAEFLANPNCRKITFTGSTEVGRELIRGAADGIKPLSLELGGQAPYLVFADCDIGRAIEDVLAAKFRNTGQSCIAANRIYVQRPIYVEFLRRLTERVQTLRIDEGTVPGVQVGLVINEAGLAKALEHITDAVGRGARKLAGGARMARPGWFLEPTLLADVPADALCMNEETFAPVAPVAAFDTEAEAVELANSTPFGLAAYVSTRDLGRMFRLAESIEAGMIGINDGVPSTSQCPFGGVKQSGWGRELGTEGMEAFLESKHASIGI